MRYTLVPSLVTAACLLGASPAALAQTSSAITMQQTPQPAPQHAAANAPSLPWASLSADQQRLLTPVHGQWDQLSSQRQHRFAHYALQWAKLPNAAQQQIQARLARWAHMSPDERHALRDNTRTFQQLSPQERAHVNAAFRRYESLSPAQRRALRERWQNMSPDQRVHGATGHPQPDQPIRMQAPTHRGH